MFSKLSHHHLSLFAAFVLLLNALSPAWVTLLGDENSPGNGLTPICTAYGIQYVSLEGGVPVEGESAPMNMMEHCPICTFELTSFGALASDSAAQVELSFVHASYLAESQFLSPAKIQGYASRAPPVFS